MKAKICWLRQSCLAESQTWNKKTPRNLIGYGPQVVKLDSLIKDIVQDKNDISDVNINKICTSSKDAKKGSLFVAINGTVNDGHDFINEAVENGASAVISNGKNVSKLSVPNIKVSNTRLAASRVSAEFYNYPSKELKVVGITGTNGKTTTASLIYSILKSANYKVAQIGTLGLIADGYDKNKTLTTPDPITLHKILRNLSDDNFSHVVMEVSSHALDQLRVADIDFDISVFTNLSNEHLDYHNDMETYFRAKSKLFRMMPITSTSIINVDDEYGARIKNESSAPVISISTKNKSDIFFKKINYSLEGINGLIRAGNEEIAFNSKLIGEFNAENIISAASVGIALNIGLKKIENGINNVKVIDGRMEVFKTSGNKNIVVDYAHTPDSYIKVLSTIKKLIGKKKKVYVLFGCGGNRDNSKRNKMGKIAADFAEKLWITPDNPRFENIDEINLEITKGLNANKYEIFNDREFGLKKAISKMKSNDTLVVLGKGREDYQDIKGKKIEYSDIEIIEKYL
ncbi:MAG: UDP-N-acetylmuramoyl-L-alanyl-D-glutamate--2,6-diaminopimelate ligase [bacterium TMED250]|nr:MAG: UDP-N-acetylmuramoyl-L-alanyl-D-glutamate--2,6-diaminopimelate ligase [bacterium TMED250]